MTGPARRCPRPGEVARTLGGMAARQQVEVPERFARAVASLRAVVLRPEVALDDVPAPSRLAPYAFAVRAEVVVGGDELASGRLVLLHDPDGQDSWDGDFRLVTFVRAELEPEIVADPLLTGVGWDWLIEALEERGAAFRAASGTITRVVSESFGTMAERPGAFEVELRASWTPTDDALGEHLAAWCELLCTTAGLPPLPPGVTALSPRSRNGAGFVHRGR